MGDAAVHVHAYCSDSEILPNARRPDSLDPEAGSTKSEFEALGPKVHIINSPNHPTPTGLCRICPQATSAGCRFGFWLMRPSPNPAKEVSYWAQS